MQSFHIKIIACALEQKNPCIHKLLMNFTETEVGMWEVFLPTAEEKLKTHPKT